MIDGREVTSVSFQNLDKADSWGTDLNGSLRLGPKFNGFRRLQPVQDGDRWRVAVGAVVRTR